MWKGVPRKIIYYSGNGPEWYTYDDDYVSIKVKTSSKSFHCFRDDGKLCEYYWLRIIRKQLEYHVIQERFAYLHLKWIREEKAAFYTFWKFHRKGTVLGYLSRDTCLKICQELERPPEPSHMSLTWDDLDKMEHLRESKAFPWKTLIVFIIIASILTSIHKGFHLVAFVLFWYLRFPVRQRKRKGRFKRVIEYGESRKETQGW